MSTRCSNQNLLSLGETSPHVSHAFTSGARSTLTRIIKRYCAANAISRVNVDHMISSTTSTDFSAAVSSSRRTLLLGAITSFEIINTIGLCSTHHANAASGLVMPNLEAQVAINAALRKVMSKGKVSAAPSSTQLNFCINFPLIKWAYVLCIVGTLNARKHACIQHHLPLLYLAQIGVISKRL
jgi:hypothetical protein